MATTVQSSYEIYPELGFPGDNARPDEPTSQDSGKIYVPDSGRNPRPGDAVMYDRTRQRFALPTSAGEAARTVGILTYRKDQVANADTITEFSNDDEVQIAVHGTFWVTAGGTVRYGDLLRWQTDDYKWDLHAVPSVSGAQSAATINALLTAIGAYPIVCVSRFEAADGDVIQARIGYGRVI